MKRTTTLQSKDCIILALSSEDLSVLKRYVAELKKKYIIIKDITIAVTGFIILPIKVSYINDLKSSFAAKASAGLRVICISVT